MNGDFGLGRGLQIGLMFRQMREQREAADREYKTKLGDIAVKSPDVANVLWERSFDEPGPFKPTTIGGVKEKRAVTAHPALGDIAAQEIARGGIPVSPEIAEKWRIGELGGKSTQELMNIVLGLKEKEPGALETTLETLKQYGVPITPEIAKRAGKVGLTGIPGTVQYLADNLFKGNVSKAWEEYKKVEGKAATTKGIYTYPQLIDDATAHANSVHKDPMSKLTPEGQQAWKKTKLEYMKENAKFVGKKVRPSEIITQADELIRQQEQMTLLNTPPDLDVNEYEVGITAENPVTGTQWVIEETPMGKRWKRIR